MMYLGMDLFASIIIGTLCNSWACMSISFTKLRKFSFSIFSDRFPISWSFSSSGTPIMWMLDFLKLSQRLLTLSSFFFYSFVFLLFWLLPCCFLLPYIPNHWFDSQLHPLYCCFPINCFLFQLMYFQFLSGSFYAAEVLTKFLKHHYNQCFELCIW